MGNMQMYANVSWMGRTEAQWEIKALRDGEGYGGDQHYELNAAILNREKNQPIVDLVVKLIYLTNRFVLMAEASKVICQTILVARAVINDGHL